MKYKELIEKAEKEGNTEAIDILKGFLDGEPESGFHAHLLDRKNKATRKDGAHRHLFILPDGRMVVTVEDGEHWHVVNRGADWAWPDASDHQHLLILPGFIEMMTIEDGEHSHNLMYETSGFDGGHIHWIVLPSGEVIRSETAGSFALRFGPRELTEEDVLPTASELLNRVMNKSSEFMEVLKGIFMPNKNQPTEVKKETGGSDLDPFQVIALAALGYEVTDLNMDLKKEETHKSPLRAVDGMRALLVSKSRYTEKEAIDLAKTNGFKVSPFTATDSHYDFPQKLKKDFVSNSFRTLKYIDGVQVVVGSLRKEDEQEFDAVYECEIFKIDEEKRQVFGVVLEPEVVDSQDDIISKEDVEKAAHGFLKNSRVIGFRHLKKADARPIESYISPVDFSQKGQFGKQKVSKGSWVLGVQVEDDELWALVLEGEIQAFSIGGFGLRSPEQ